MTIMELRNRITMGLDNIRRLTETVTIMECQLQPDLQAFVNDKNISLDDRFKCWSQHCEKRYKGDLTARENGTLIEQMIADDCPMCFENRGRDYSWDHFIDYFEEDERSANDGDWHEGHLKKYKMTLDDFKEFLIAENFGYFTWDW